MQSDCDVQAHVDDDDIMDKTDVRPVKFVYKVRLKHEQTKCSSA